MFKASAVAAFSIATGYVAGRVAVKLIGTLLQKITNVVTEKAGS